MSVNGHREVSLDAIIDKAQTPDKPVVDELHELRLGLIQTVKEDCLRDNGKYKKIFDDEFKNILTQLRKVASTTCVNHLEVKTKIGMYNELFAFVVYGLFKNKLKALDKRFECATFINDSDQLCFRIEWPYTDEEEGER